MAILFHGPKPEGPPSYTVTYAANGANGTAPAARTVNTGTVVTLPSNGGLNSAGNIFIGWSESSTGIGLTYFIGDSVTVIQDMVFYAQWINDTAVKYAVTFNPNGATGGTPPMLPPVFAGMSVTFPGPGTLVASNRTFAGWNTEQASTGTHYNAGSSHTVTGNITLYATWSATASVPYTVAFNSGGGSNIPAQTVISGFAASRPVDPTRSGYVFDNWYSDSGLTAVYNFSTPVTGNITLYAKWNAAAPGSSYTVTFNSNGGSNVPTQTVNSGGAVVRPASPSRSGYTFVDWYGDSGLNTVYNFAAPVMGNITLYAKWNALPAGTYIVTSGADSGPGTLRDAIENALNDSTITIDSSVRTISLTGSLEVYKNITIEGNGVTITRDPSWTTYSELMFVSGTTATISRIHFKDSRVISGAAIYNSWCNMTLESCIFSGNQGINTLYGYSGSAIFNVGTMSVKSCTFYGNSAAYSGGTIFHEQGTLTLEGNLFYGNTATHNPVVYHNNGTVTSRGYNVVDVPFGTGENQCGWPAVIGDKNISDFPFSTTTFRLFPGSGAANVITTRPTGYPTVDFYGNPIPASGAAAGAVQSQVSGSGYNLELTVNDASRGTVNTSPVPNQDGLFSGTVTLTANAHTGYDFSYWLVDGEQSGSANPLTLTMSKHTKVQAAFGRVVLVTNFNDDMYSETTAGTLRNALANAQDWDIIRFSGVTAGTSTVALYDKLPTINKSISIEGNGVTLTKSTAWTTVDYNSQLIYVNDLGSKTLINISRVHFKDGRTAGFGGAIHNDHGDLILESCIFTGNQTGAIYNGPGNKLIVKSCTFYGNSGGDGTIDYSGSTTTLIGNLFYGNTSFLLVYPSGFSNGYNAVDVVIGRGSNKTGWDAATGDTTFEDLGITGTPINTTTFAPVSGLGSVIPNPPPQGFPATDFYGNTRTFPGAPGAVK
jgi:uncharacterized repeat protein (TIGR02543 family)